VKKGHYTRKKKGDGPRDKDWERTKKGDKGGGAAGVQ